MSRAPAEFSRQVLLARLGSEPFHQHIAASEVERDALARRFDLVSLDRLDAEVELVREPAGTILLSATFEAAFAQACIVTFDPVPGQIGECFQLRYGPPEAEDEARAGDDGPTFEPLESDSIDIGEAVAQEFSLALPPFPRAADAVIEVGVPTEDEANSPFAALAKFRRGEPQ